MLLLETDINIKGLIMKKQLRLFLFYFLFISTGVYGQEYLDFKDDVLNTPLATSIDNSIQSIL